MGSGGGGGSRRKSQSQSVQHATPKKTSPKPGTGVGGAGGGDVDVVDPCDLYIDVDLESVQPNGLQASKVDDGLDIQLETRGAVRAAVCVRRDGTVVGSLVGFAGLTQLLACVARGHKYTVKITKLTRTSCHVQGGRSSKP